jgi:hypothetical protein
MIIFLIVCDFIEQSFIILIEYYFKFIKKMFLNK